MKNVLPYHTDLHLDAGTKKLIQQMISSIRSVVPVTEEPGPRHGIPSCREGNKGQDERDYIMNVLVRARSAAHLLEGIADPSELRRYARYAEDYRDLVILLERLLDDVRKCQTIAASYATKMAEMMEEHIRMVQPDNEDFPLPEDEFKLKVV